MKKFLSVAFAFLLVFSTMTFQVSAHDECTALDCEIHIENISDETIQPTAIVCGHDSSLWEVVGISASSHSLRCSVCGATDDYSHTSRNKCEDYSCKVCDYYIGFINHKTELDCVDYDDYQEAHAYVCTRYWSGIQCSYMTGRELCASYATGDIWYQAASDGVHRKLQECTKCGIGVYKGTVVCHKSIGETTCPYCK